MTIISSPNTMLESSTFTGSMFALSCPKISRTVSSSSVSSPLPPEPVFFDSVTFLSVERRILAHRMSLRVLAPSMFAPMPFN